MAKKTSEEVLMTIFISVVSTLDGGFVAVGYS